MKICLKCGKHLESDWAACPYCGNNEHFKEVQGERAEISSTDKKPLDVFGLVGMCVSVVAFLIGMLASTLVGIIFAVVGIVFSGVGYCRRQTCSLYGFSYAGLATGIATIVILIICWIAVL